MKDKLLEIISFYGIYKQLKYIHSEYFELDEAILNYQSGSYLGCLNCQNQEQEMKYHIAEEIADVTCMLKQFQYYYDIKDEEIKKIMEEKVDRQLVRIDKEKMIRK